MSWMTEPKMWDDKWFRTLESDAQNIWQLCIGSSLRTSLPGLIRNADAMTIAGTWGKPIDRVAAALEELVAPDREGKQHFFIDSNARVIRMPAAPKYNKAINPNVLTAWFRAWKDVPDCELKFLHLFESIPLGVNFSNEVMFRCWNNTFGHVLNQLRNPAPMPGGMVQLPLPRNGNGSPIIPSGSGLGSERGSGSGSGSDHLAMVSESSINGSWPTEITETYRVTGKNGVAGNGAGGQGNGADGGNGTGRPEAGPGGPTGGVPGGGQPGGHAGEDVPVRRRKLPPWAE